MSLIQYDEVAPVSMHSLSNRALTSFTSTIAMCCGALIHLDTITPDIKAQSAQSGINIDIDPKIVFPVIGLIAAAVLSALVDRKNNSGNGVE